MHCNQNECLHEVGWGQEQGLLSFSTSPEPPQTSSRPILLTNLYSANSLNEYLSRLTSVAYKENFFTYQLTEKNILKWTLSDFILGYWQGSQLSQ